MKRYKDLYGNVWVTGPEFICSPYGGGGAVGAANIMWLQSYADTHEDCRLGDTGAWRGDNTSIKFHIGTWKHIDGEYRESDQDMSAYDILIYKDIHGEQAFVREGTACEELKEALDALEVCPAFDDEYVTDVEEYWERAAWEDDARRELVAKALAVHGRTLEHFIQVFAMRREFMSISPDDLLWQAYRGACDDLAYQPVYEYDSAYIDTDFLAPTFAVHVMRLLHKAVIKRG